VSNSSRQKTAALRICSSCEWVFERPVQPVGPVGFFGCPKCGGASYGARWVLGPSCYRVKKTQDRWLKRKLEDYERELRQQIGTANAERDPNDLFRKS